MIVEEERGLINVPFSAKMAVHVLEQLYPVKISTPNNKRVALKHAILNTNVMKSNIAGAL